MDWLITGLIYFSLIQIPKIEVIVYKLRPGTTETTVDLRERYRFSHRISIKNVKMQQIPKDVFRT